MVSIITLASVILDTKGETANTILTIVRLHLALTVNICAEGQIQCKLTLLYRLVQQKYHGLLENRVT